MAATGPSSSPGNDGPELNPVHAMETAVAAPAQGERTIPQPTPTRSWYALGVFAVVTLFAFVDRSIFSLLAEPIRRDLGLTDLQLGLLQGTGVAVFAALAAYPLGWLADRYDRRVVLAASLMFWSAAVAACGFATSFGQLFVAGALVGAGEAALVPIVFSLIPELFRPDRRQLANSIYAASSQTGGAVAMAICGALIAGVGAIHASLPWGLSGWADWRLSFLAAALPAPLMVALILTLPAPARAARRAAPETIDTRALIAYLGAHRATVLPFMIGVGSAIFGFAAVSAWTPIVLMREYSWTAAEIGARWSVIALIALGSGFVVSAFVLKPFARRMGPRLNVRVLGIACLIAVCTYALLPFTSTGNQVLLLNGLTSGLLASASMLFPTALQGLAPARFRARVVAVQAIVNLVFGASAAPAVGALSDRLHDVHYGLMWAISCVAIPGLLVGAALMFWCERGYPGVFSAAEREDAASG